MSERELPDWAPDWERQYRAYCDKYPDKKEPRDWFLAGYTAGQYAKEQSIISRIERFVRGYRMD